MTTHYSGLCENWKIECLLLTHFVMGTQLPDISEVYCLLLRGDTTI